MLLDAVIKDGLEKAVDRNNLRIHKIVVGQSFATMKDQDEVFSNLFPYLVLLEDAYGFAYAEAPLPEATIKAVVNRDVREVLTDTALAIPVPLKVALCDALHCATRSEAPATAFRGDLDSMAWQRSDAVLTHIPDGSHVLFLGIVSEFIKNALQRNMTVRVCDRTEQKIGREYYGVPVEAAATLRETLASYPTCTHIVATGMIFVSDTADEVFAAAEEHGAALGLYMETGGRFASALTARGASFIVAEEFPFYDFNGPTHYMIHT